MEYAIYPFRVMNITQRYDEGNHIPHWKGFKDYADKPWDEALGDTGRSYFEPRNDFKVIEKSGSQSVGFNVRLTSVNKLTMPSGRVDYLHLTLTHMNSDDMAKITVGQVLKAGTKVLREGTSGKSTGNHFHITANVGQYHGLKKNNNGSWVFAYDKSLLPEEAFYLDRNYTTIKNAKGIKFIDLPKPKTDYIGKTVKRDEYSKQIEVKVKQLIVRDKPNLKGNRLGYANLGIYSLKSKTNSDGYVWYELGSNMYAPSKDNWVVELAYKEKPIEPPIKEPSKEEEKEPDTVPNELKQVFEFKVPKTGRYYIGLKEGEVLKIYE